MGKPITQSREEIDFSIQKALHMSQWADDFFKEEVLYSQNGVTKKTIREPLGTVLSLLPWESPVLETVFSLVPSILCGNSILLKDNPDTPIIAKHFENAFKDSAPGLAQ